MLQTFLTEILKLAPRQIWGVEQQIFYLKEIFTSFSPKRIVASILAIIELFGLTVFDLGVDVPAEVFIEKAIEEAVEEGTAE